MDNQTQTKTHSYKKAPISSVHHKVYLAIVLGQIACGYTLGISGSALNQTNLSDFWSGLIGAGSLIGLMASLLVGRLADQFGRRNMLLLNMFGLAALSLVHLVITDPGWVFVLRVIIGVMLAIDYTVGNAWLVEWMPLKKSAAAQSTLLIFWTIGFIAAYLFGSWAETAPGFTWQMTFASSIVFALITAIFRILARIPSSPSWLASQGQQATAQRVIKKNLGKIWRLPKQLMRVKEPAEVSWQTLFSKQYRRQTIVGSLFYACQAFAFFGISIFLPSLLDSMQLTGDSAGILYNGAMLVGVIIGIRLFERISRRVFLIGSFFGSMLLLIILIMWQGASSNQQLIIFSLFAVLLSSSLVLDYPYTSELFDVKVRGMGVGFCVTISRIGAAAGTFLLPIFTSFGGANLTMLVCAIILGIGGLICLGWAPETSPVFKK